MLDPQHSGRTFPTFQYTLEAGKVREFAAAIGDANPHYQQGQALPPTFPTVFSFWGGFNLEDMLAEIGLSIWQVLHGEQEYEYLHSVSVGDTITGQARIESIETRRGMTFLNLYTEYHLPGGQLALIERTNLIIREQAE